jgi:hypothetical protein
MIMKSLLSMPRQCRQFTVLLLAWVVAWKLAVPAQADGNPLHGAHPRPFYVFEHNPNTVGDAEAALKAGANALGMWSESWSIERRSLGCSRW